MRYIVKAILHFDDGINKGQLQVQANSEEEALAQVVKKLTDTWKIKTEQIEVISIKKLGARMTDSTDESTTGKSTRTMEEVSKDIRSGGEEAPHEESLEPGGKDHVEPDGDEVQPTDEPVMPAPKPKTPEEIAQNPQDAVNEEVLKKLGAK